jgi:nucleotide-binding universal stress UspA family protein
MHQKTTMTNNRKEIAMFQNILLAYDGSDHSRRAAEIAGNLARCYPNEVELWVVSVVDPVTGELGEPFLSEAIERGAATGQALLDEAVSYIGDVMKIHREVLFGEPSDCIVEVAETRACDLIVIGSRGLGVLKSLLLGSRAQKVIHNAPCPVLVVK